jgi:hypothetical protein
MESKPCIKCQVEIELVKNRNICKECLSIHKKEYYLKNKTTIKDKSKKYYSVNKEKKIIYQKEYNVLNKEEINKQRNIYYKEKRKNGIFRLKHNIRSLIKNSINRSGYKKNSKTNIILGCSYEEFILHIESLFKDWMGWENYGKYNGDFDHGWDIDHIIPISSTKTEIDLLELNNYKNLQPLCSKVNRDIKRNIIL